MLVDSAREFTSIPADAIQPPGEGVAGFIARICGRNRDTRESECFGLEPGRADSGV
jgi:hypothetical protein